MKHTAKIIAIIMAVMLVICSIALWIGSQVPEEVLPPMWIG